MRNKAPFYLIIIDDDNNVFNVLGPMTKDHEWNKKVVEQQQAGRNVRCFSDSKSDSIESSIRRFSNEGKYKYSAALIVNKPEENISIVIGTLPIYARNANRRRIVKILCRGRCNMERFAEMDVDFPGEDALKRSQVGDFSAKCLKCGYVAIDPYNWYR